MKKQRGEMMAQVEKVYSQNRGAQAGKKQPAESADIFTGKPRAIVQNHRNDQRTNVFYRKTRVKVQQNEISKSPVFLQSESN
jgi:hypothetical protein